MSVPDNTNSPKRPVAAMEPEGRLLHQSEFAIRWGDMDAMGHVNNIMYFRYFEQVRLEWYDQVVSAPLASTSEGMVIVDNHAEYLKPIVYPAFVKAKMYGHTPGRSSFVSTYFLTVDDVLYTRGSSKIVWIDMAIGKSMPLPQLIRAQLETDDIP